MNKILLLMALTLSTNIYSQSSDNDPGIIFSVAGVLSDSVKGIEDDEDKLNYGAGALVEFSLNDHFGLETGALLIKRQYSFKVSELEATQTVSRLHVPMMARFWFSDYFSIAGGPFLSWKTGDAQTNVAFGDTDLIDVKTSANETTQFGLETAATLNFAINDKTGLFVEGRYSSLLGKENNEESQQISAFTGIKFNL